jgi:DNA-binding response OmpR family regulator
LARPVLLVVDDDPNVVEMVSASVDGLVVEVRAAADAAEAMRLFGEDPPDLVILDVGLPDRDGFELLREMRAASDVPVLMLTARAKPTDQLLGLELGADLYVTKPFSPRVLRARLASMLRRAASDT